MKTAKLLAPMLGLLLFAGCNKQPAAKIEASKTNVRVGESIQFTNETEDGETFEWDFGDGTDSDEREPSKTYTKPGMYTVEMTAYSKKKKKKDQDEIDIVVTQPDNAIMVGTYAVESYFSESWCDNGFSNYDSDYHSYEIVIRAGTKDNEILIDNLGNLGINNVRATVTKISGSGFEMLDFKVVTGQVLKDSQGRTWSYSSNDITGNYTSGFGMTCFTFYVSLDRTETCGGFSNDYYFSDSGDNGC